MKQLFYKGRSGKGFSCMNEPFRMLSGMIDESAFNGDGQSEAWEFIWNSTLANAAKCVPLILERPGNNFVTGHWFPQFRKFFNTTFKTPTVGDDHHTCQLSQAH